MARVSFASIGNAEIISSPPGCVGGVETRALFMRETAPLHLCVHRLNAEAQLRVVADVTEKAIFLWKGRVRTGGTELSARSSAVVEYGAALTFTAGREGASLLEFSAKAREAGARDGGHVHLMPGDRVTRIVNTHSGKRAGMALHANAQCPTCKVWLHENQYWDGDVETELHHHSQDEVMFVTGGGMRVGNRIYREGSALSVAANTKYGFFSGADGLAFVNYRNGVSTYTRTDGSMHHDEGEIWRQVCGDPRPLTSIASAPV
jgi:hypothetical protein